MRKLMIGLVAVSLLATVPTAVAEETREESGEIVGHPGTLAFGASELTAACEPGAETDGIDGKWFEISNFAGGDFVLDPADTLDADAYFYDADCGFVDAGLDGAEEGLGAAEDGQIPDEASFVVVDGFAGQGSFDLMLTN
jgi:hypothetical protein